MKKVLLSILGASAILAALLSTGCSTEPKGTEGKITFSDTLVLGAAKADTVILKDADLTADTQSVKVTSTIDPVGISLLLTGKSGVYKGLLGFSTAASGAGTIQVSQNCIVTVTYKDLKPAGTRTETFIWKAGTMAVAFDNTSYQGINTPVVITVNDPNTSSPTVTVNVMSTTFSTAFPVTLAQSAGVFGQYTGNVYFTVSTAMTSKDTVHVKNGDSITVTYIDPVTPSASVVAKAGWTAAQPITVTPGAASYSGLAGKMTINVADQNVTTPTITVHLTSHKDATGIDVVLTAVSGSAGSYSAQVGVSLTASGLNVIAVMPPADTMFVSYSDPALSSPILGTVIWQASSVSIVTDSSAYNGTTEQMAISLTNDHTTAATLVVNVSSAKAGDTIPVTLTAVTATPWIFTGTVGFSLGVKTATAVGVNDSDQVTVSYFDSVKSETKSATVNWYSHLIRELGIFSSIATPASLVDTTATPVLYNWTNTVTFDQIDSTGVDGSSKALMVTAGAAGWAGFGWANTIGGVAAGISKVGYANCSLHVSLKGNATGINLLVENYNPNGNTIPQTWIAASNTAVGGTYVADGQWHDCVIPLSAWSATCDFTNLCYYLGVTFSPYTAGQYLVIDNVYWTLPATPSATPAAKRLAKKLAK